MRPRPALFTITNGVTACMMIAALSLLSVQAIGPLHAIVLAAAILWSRRKGGPVVRPFVWDGLAMVALLMFPLDLFVLSRSLIEAALRLLTFVVIYRCSNLPGRRELRQAVALSFVQILAAAASTTEAYFGLLLAFYLSMAIWTLMAMASARDDAPPAARRPPAGRPVMVMTASTVALGGVLFFLIPHFGTGYLQQAGAIRGATESLSGFSNRIELGSISRIKKNHAIVMRVKVDSSRVSGATDSTPLRWRGMALDTFDGRSWSVATPGIEWLGMDREGWFEVGAPIESGRPALVEEISLEPSLMSLLFVPPGSSRIMSESLPALGVDAGGSIHLQTPGLRRFGYRVVSLDPEAALAGFGLKPDEDLPRYLTLPSLDARIQELTTRVIAKAGSDVEKARLIEAYLRTSYPYSLDVNDAGVPDPVARFLIERSPGHCEYFATSMALMLRYLGIPSRVINGFASGRWSGLTGSYIVRQSDAHSWVEAWIPESGWVTFDPTPAGPDGDEFPGLLTRLSRAMDRAELMWDTWIVGLDLLDQQSLAATLMEAVEQAVAGVRQVFIRLASLAGWIATALLSAAAAVVLFVAVRVGWRGWGRWRGHSRRAVLPATELLRRFEALWAARGFRRSAGQTPLEFAREIERRAPDPQGAPREFVEKYYRVRYGPARKPGTT